MNSLKDRLRPLVPQFALNWFHWCEAVYWSARYHHPANEMIVIGIVGSKGKTTTANLTWAALSAGDELVGQFGTANVRIGAREELNRYHMTMPGPAILQRELRRMAEAGCRYVVLEVPSEGQAQFRHVGINFDVLIFTNITNEILQIHHRGSLEVLKKHNARVFKRLSRSQHKTFNDIQIPKTIIVNADSPDAPYYNQYTADKHISFAIHHPADFRASDLKTTAHGTDFAVNELRYHLPILGEFNVINALGAIATASELNLAPAEIKQGLESVGIIPGRMEVIDEGQPFTVIVDYAHEPTGLGLLLDSAVKLKTKSAKIILHLGAEGGGRDVQKRPEMGALAAAADIVIIGNVDPYDDDPQTIIEDVARGAEENGKVRDQDLFCIEDRRAGIRKALQLAGKNDLVLITGKGAEQSMIIGKQKLKWDDRTVVREELRKLHKKSS